MVGAMTEVTSERIHTCGEDGPLAVETASLKDLSMDGTGDEVFHFPREAIIGDRLQEAV